MTDRVAGGRARGREDRCSTGARRSAIDPVGTAGGYDGFLLVTWPLPWPRDAAEVEELAEVVARIDALAADGRRHRLQLVTGDAAPPPGAVTLVRYTRRGDGFAGFARREETVPAGDVAAAACALLDGDGSDDEPPSGERVADLLVCTHGSRDVCCGTDGTVLYQALQRRRLPGTRLWRTSHTGGHRFAPTAITLPDGHGWAYLDEEVVAAVVGRDPDCVPSVREHCRGATGLPTPAAQAVDREAFVREGWTWLASHRVARSTVGGDGATDVVLEVTRPDGSTGAYRATVTAGDPVEVPPCRSGPGKATVDRPPVVQRFAEA